MIQFKSIQAGLLAIAVLAISTNAFADTVDFRDNGSFFTTSLTEGIVTVTGSGQVGVSINGLGISGSGTSAISLEPGETMTFSFSTPVSDVVLIDIFPSDIGNNGLALNATLESFDASGTSTAIVATAIGSFSPIDVSNILGVASMSSFSITMNNDSIRIGGVSFPEIGATQLTILVDQGKLVGIQGLEVGSDIFDVAFLDGSFDDLFTAASIVPIFIGDEPGAIAAASAIIQVLTSDGRFINSPQSIGGCSSLEFCIIAITFDGPFSTGIPANPFGVEVQNAFIDTDSPGSVFSQFLATNITFGGEVTFPVFTPATGSTPTTLLEQLGTAVVGVGPGNSLADKVALAQTYFAASDVEATCAVLTDFMNQVSAQRGKKLTLETADQLTADAQAIMDAIGCN